MSPQICPVCNSPLPQRGWLDWFIFPQCEECGWKQRASAQSWIRQAVPIAFGIFVLAILWARDSWGFLLFFILLQLTFYLIGVRRAKKFAEPIPSILTPGKVSHASSAQSSKAETRREKPRCPPEYEYIFTLPRPRRLRARKIVFLGWLFLIVFFLVFGSLVIRDAHSWLSPGWLSKMNKSPLIIVGIFCLLVFDLFSLLFMQKPRIRES